MSTVAQTDVWDELRYQVQILSICIESIDQLISDWWDVIYDPLRLPWMGRILEQEVADLVVELKRPFKPKKGFQSQRRERILALQKASSTVEEALKITFQSIQGQIRVENQGMHVMRLSLVTPLRAIHEILRSLICRDELLQAC
jgi:hypothetical protein